MSAVLARSRGGGRLLVYVEACADACVDAERGFATAARLVTDPELRAFFQMRANERARFAKALGGLIESSGFAYCANGSLAGRAHRGFLSARALLVGNDRSILAECERGEHETKRLYTIARHEAAKIGALDALRDVLDAHARAIDETEHAMRSMKDDLR